VKPFLVRFAVFFALQLGVAAVLAGLYRPSDQHYLAGTIAKHRLLETAPSPRLVMVGGSSVPFSVDCDSLAAGLPYHPIDMGLHVALGAGLILNEVKDGLRRGDVAVVSFEYELFDMTEQPDVVIRLLNARPRSARYLPVDYLPGLLDYGLSYAGIIVRGALDGLRGRTELIEAPYCLSAFNAYGDVVARPKLPKVPPIEIAVLPTGRLGRHFGATLAELNRFHAECERKGVRVYFAYPPTPATRYRLHKDEIAKFQAALEPRLTIPRLDAPEDVIFPDEYFYDTEYHLTAPGVALRSHRLLEALSARLATPPSGPR
jgi:hypothetical protein